MTSTTKIMRPELHAIFEYEDFRRFLSDTFAAAKARKPVLSHRWIAANAGFKSSGFFSKILSGSVNIGPETVERFVALMDLPPREARYFAALVEHGQTDDPAVRKRLQARLRRLREGESTRLEKDQERFWSSPRHAVVREALWVHPLSGHDTRYGERFVPRIPHDRLGESIDLLQQLGLAVVDDAGLVVRSDTRTLSSGKKSREKSVAGYQRECLDMGLAALVDHPAEPRHLSTLTFSFPRSRWEELEGLTRQYRAKVLELAAQAETDDTVFQLNLHLFPVFLGTPA